MKLISFPTSPFARKVRIAAIEIGLTDRIEVQDASPFAEDGVVTGANPLGKIPALVLDDRTIVDSPLICAYLDTLHDGEKLHPAGDWHTLGMQALADGMMDAAVLLRLETQRPESERSSFWMGRYEAAIGRTSAELAAGVAALGDRISVGSIATFCSLGYLDFRHPHMSWRSDHPHLATWFATWNARPSARETAPPPGHPGAGVPGGPAAASPAASAATKA